MYNQTFIAQALMILSTALLALGVIMTERNFPFEWKFPLRYDIMLLVTAMVGPGVLGGVLLGIGGLGPSGAWCYVQHNSIGWNKVIPGIMLTIYILCCLLYVATVSKIWYISRNAYKYTNQETGELVTFVKLTSNLLVVELAYFGQWMFYMLFEIWNFVEQPAHLLLVTMIVFNNMGGGFNLVVHNTMIKLKPDSGKRREGGEESKAAHSWSRGESQIHLALDDLLDQCQERTAIQENQTNFSNKKPKPNFSQRSTTKYDSHANVTKTEHHAPLKKRSSRVHEIIAEVDSENPGYNGSMSKEIDEHANLLKRLQDENGDLNTREGHINTAHNNDSATNRDEIVKLEYKSDSSNLDVKKHGQKESEIECAEMNSNLQDVFIEDSIGHLRIEDTYI
ncbi:unnamed protein product [Owenia fusiformis]|uniref:Uncharacterized protein n=1 Tax=Owenia fusiformis TaxID=6347 RepID=A0A8J1UMY2_OWEFU|nr:unnamed protein product [Owenia fusiformis]